MKKKAIPDTVVMTEGLRLLARALGLREGKHAADAIARKAVVALIDARKATSDRAAVLDEIRKIAAASPTQIYAMLLYDLVEYLKGSK